MTSPFESAEAYLDSLGVDAMRARRPSLHRIEAMLEALDHPERSIPALHITGTNGKTSTARIATSLLVATGLSVGTFTSPHLTSIRERIALSGEPITADAFGALFDHLWPYLQVVEKELDDKLSYFEVLTAMFFLWAVETPVDVVVVEVGLGGRWDATNVVPAQVAAITNVGLDHTRLLGEEREKIALEKAGIIKPGAVVVTAERTPSVLEVLRAEAAGVGADMSLIDRDFAVDDNRVALGGRYMSLRTSVQGYEGVFLSLHGSHQATNAAVALEATTRLLPARPPDRTIVQEGFGNTHVPGRLEARTLSGPGATMVFDVAHNPEAMSALVRGLVETFSFERVKVVIGVLGDKDYGGMLAELTRLPCSLLVTEPTTDRAAPASDLEFAAKQLGLECVAIPDVDDAVATALDSWSDGELVCVTGSHYVVGRARDAIASRLSPEEVT
jgi:dihydrofolate synthase/folylpolyglutamate synthase